MEFRLLGPLEVSDRGQHVALGGQKQRSLLALLLLHANEVVSRDRLVDELWGGEAPLTASKAVQVHVSQLRKGLERRDGGVTQRLVVTRPGGYMIQLTGDQLDLDWFERLRHEGQQARSEHDPVTASAKLREALALWRGPPLSDLGYEPFAQPEIARLGELRLTVLEERIDADLALGRHAELVAELQALAAAHPQRERIRGQLMLALYRSGRQTEALDAYRDTRRTLVDELGIEPGRELQALERAILVQDPALDLERDRPKATVGPSAGSFIGRERELAEFAAGLQDAFAHRPSVLLLAGEPGIGKSRLADELTTQAEGRGAKVLWGRSWEAGGAPAYWPWVQALRTYIREHDKERIRRELGTGARDVAQMLPELHELFPDLPAPPSMDPEGARFRLFDSTAAFLRAAGEAQPLVLVIDDLHAADTPSLLLLRFLARELREARILLVGAYRDTDAGPDDALNVTVAELRREPLTRLIQLGGLALPEVARFIETIAGAPASDLLAAAIHTQTEGNPLFVGELVRLLDAEGRLEEAGTPQGGPNIPRGVRDVIGHRLRHLSQEAKRLLAVASVLGREFKLDALELVSERSGDDLLDLLDEAVAARVIVDLPTGRGGLRFTHALIRDSLYEGLGRKERHRLHQRAAEELEALYGPGQEPHLAQLAHHFLQAAPGGDVQKAIEYARRAGDRAAAVLAYEEAARLYEMALEASELQTPPDEPTRCELLLARGDAQGRGGDLLSAKDTFSQAADLAQRLGAPEQFARAALGYGGRFVWFRAGNDQRLIPLLEGAIEAIPDDSLLRARLLARLAGALRDHPVPQRRASLSREAVEIARRLGDRSTLAYALEGTYAALCWPRDTGSWLAMARELSELAAEVGDKEKAFAGHIHAFGAFMVRGDLSAAEAEFAALTALADELRQPAQMWALTMAQTTRASFKGRFDEAERYVERAQLRVGGRRALDGVDHTTFHYVTHLQAWALQRERGGLADILESLEAFAADFPAFFMFRCLLASAYADLENTQAAREALDQLAAEDFAGLETGTEWFVGASLLAEVCVFLGDARRAAPLYAALLPYSDCNVLSMPEFSLGSASRPLGILASTMSRWEQAAGHFEQAIEMNSAMGALPWVAHTQHDYARMLLMKNAPADNPQALELIRKALATYRELEMDIWAERACALERELNNRPLSDPPHELVVE
jgi:DNA-binding SARP family transcriptional activator